MFSAGRHRQDYVPNRNRLSGVVDEASASRSEDPGFEFRLRRDFFSGSSHTSDLKDRSARCQYTVTG